MRNGPARGRAPVGRRVAAVALAGLLVGVTAGCETDTVLTLRCDGNTPLAGLSRQRVRTVGQDEATPGQPTTLRVDLSTISDPEGGRVGGGGVLPDLRTQQPYQWVHVSFSVPPAVAHIAGARVEGGNLVLDSYNTDGEVLTVYLKSADPRGPVPYADVELPRIFITAQTHYSDEGKTLSWRYRGTDVFMAEGPGRPVVGVIRCETPNGPQEVNTTRLRFPPA